MASVRGGTRPMSSSTHLRTLIGDIEARRRQRDDAIRAVERNADLTPEAKQRQIAALRAAPAAELAQLAARFDEERQRALSKLRSAAHAEPDLPADRDRAGLELQRRLLS